MNSQKKKHRVVKRRKTEEDRLKIDKRKRAREGQKEKQKRGRETME